MTSIRAFVLVAFSAIVAAILAFLAAKHYFSGQPAPGDIIILRPEPNDPNLPTSSQWTIGGDDPTPVNEPVNSTNLNATAFTYLHEYYIRAKLNGAGTAVKLLAPDELRATFGHCSDYPTNPFLPCTSDADCNAAQCVRSTFRLTWETGARKKLHWYLKPSPNDGEVELQPHTYADRTSWRAELCGRLIGNIEATYNGKTYLLYPLGGMASIQAEKP